MHYNSNTGEFYDAIPATWPARPRMSNYHLRTDLHAADGWMSGEQFALPEGRVKIDGTRRVEIADGVAREVFDTETIEDRDARLQAAEADRIAQETAGDVVDCWELLAELALALGVFDGIKEGDAYADISKLMRSQTMQEQDHQRKTDMIAAAAVAENVYRELRDDYQIDGARLWRALAALKGGGQ
jgi:hypothetical protein